MTVTLFFDTETTGLPKNRDADALKEKGNWPDLVSISWSLYQGHDCIKRRSCIIKPGDWTIPDSSVRIHCITTEIAMKDGIPLGDALFELRDDIKMSNRIIAHNMDFDKNVLFNAFTWRLNTDVNEFWPKAVDAVFCSLQKSKNELKIPGKFPRSRDPYKMPGLDELYRATFKEDAPSGAHNAERDVRVLEKIVIARWPHLII